MAFLVVPLIHSRLPRRSNAPHGRRRTTTRACSSSSPRTRIALWQDVAKMETQLKRAVHAQRFRDAAQLRDQIETLRLTDDYIRLKAALDAAVAEQRFAEACVLRDDLRKLTPPPVVRGDIGGSPLVEAAGPVAAEIESAVTGGGEYPSTSIVETKGIAVRTDSWHMPEHDGDGTRGEEGLVKYMFRYKVVISNNTGEPVQLVGRHWIIENCSGIESEVKGAGVVGRQPVIEAGESFEYTSACPLSCQPLEGSRIVGNMRGFFHFVCGPMGNKQLSVEVGRFYFVLPDAE
jgi:ApaG protein